MLFLKKCFLILSLSILISAGQIPTWQRQYGISDRADFAFGGIVETNDGDFVVCGGTWNMNPAISWDKDGYIVKINRFGDTLWTRTIGSTAGDYIFDVILNNNGELIFVGSRYVSPLVERQVWFLKYDTEGNLLQEKRFGGAMEDNANEIIQNPDGTYMILGDTKSFGSQNGGKDVWLLKLNNNGDTIWTKTYDFGYQDQGQGIIPFQGNKYLMTVFNITGQLGPPTFAYMGFGTYLVIDSVGNILKSVVFDRDSLDNLDCVANTDDGGAIITGQTSVYDNFPCRDVWVLKLNTDADTVWSKTYGAYNKYDGGLSIFQSDNGGYYLSAYSQTYTPPGMEYDNWWLLRLNGSGDTVWTRWWGGPLNDDPTFIIPTSDNGIIIAGWKDANSWDSLTIGPVDFWVIKADTLGYVQGAEEKSVSDLYQSKMLWIYPEPFYSITTINFSLPYSSVVSLIIYDALGRKVQTLIDGEILKGNNSISYNAQHLAGGIYFCVLKIDNKFLDIRKLTHLK